MIILRFKYDYLDIDITKKNLENFNNNLIFNKGLIPSVFQKAQNPTQINWLHIDLKFFRGNKIIFRIFF